MILRTFSLLFLAALPLFAETAPNTLSDEEKSGGWKLLFDGTSTKGWHVVGKSDTEGSGWVAEDGELRLKRDPSKNKTPGKDILTDQDFGDFELVWERKIAPAGNSGVKYNLPDKNKNIGCEYQMLDDDKHPDGKVKAGTHTTASLYDLIAPQNRTTKPVGEWNSSRILVKGNHVEHWLNGQQTVTFEFGSEELKKLIASSKFRDTKGWGIKTNSPILLQDHGDEASVRNIKVRTPQ